MTRFVAVCGMPGSGKSVLSETARRLQWSIRTMGDVVRSEVERLGLEDIDFADLPDTLRN